MDPPGLSVLPGPKSGNAVHIFGTPLDACRRLACTSHTVRRLRAPARVHRILIFTLGVVLGQWLVVGSAVSPPDPTFHYLKGAALAWLGLERSALDAYQTALLLEPPPGLVHRVLDDIARLTGAPGPEVGETTVPLEAGLGVWIAPVVLNGARAARFLVDTGSSVTVLSPRLAAVLGLTGRAGGPLVELQTIGGRTAGPSVILSSLRVGDFELREAPAVLHDPGPGLDGILGNTFLSRYRITLDADRRQLHLLRLPRD
jgi:clan AA aspartic protease (TIGR02281 family)